MATFAPRSLLACLRPASILFVAAVVRVLWVVACPNEPSSDQTTYHAGAVSIASGLGYRDKAGEVSDYYPVGYPAALAPFYYVLGHAPSSAFAANLLLGLLSVFALYLLGRELFGEEVGRAAALALAVYPTFVMYTTCVASENAYIPAILLGLWLSLRLGRAQRWFGLAVLTGIAFGVACLARSNGVLLIPVVGLALWLRSQPIAGAAARLAVVGAVIGAVLLPWALRNQAQFGRLTPFSMNGGVNFWMGNHEGGNGRYSPPPDPLMALPQAARDGTLMELGLAFVRENPLRYAQLCVLRTIHTLSSDTSAVRWNEIGLLKRVPERVLWPMKIGTSLVHVSLFGLLLVLLAVTLRRRAWRREDLLVAAALAASAVPFVFIVASDRYHLPLTPFVMSWCAALGLRGRPTVDAARNLP